MEIVLGIYNTVEWDALLAYYTHWKSYPFYDRTNIEWNKSVMNIVEDAVRDCTFINFILDEVKLPLNIIHSYTCEELSLILDTPQFLEKTTFWLKGKILPTQELLDKIRKAMEYNSETIKL